MFLKSVTRFLNDIHIFYFRSHNTWEDASNIAHCREILADFREHRIQEGFNDSEDDTPVPPPPVVKKRRTRKRKNQQDIETPVEMDLTPEMTPQSVESTSKKISTQLSENDDSNSSQTSIRMVNLSTAIDIIGATYTEMGKYFCVKFSNDTKYWISNDECRKYLPQLLLDFYENCSIYMEPGSTEINFNNATVDSGINFDEDENSQQNDDEINEISCSVSLNQYQPSETDSQILSNEFSSAVIP